MKLTKRGEYRSKRESSLGRKRFSYAVSGTPEEIAAFKTQQGDFFIEDENETPIWNLTQDHGRSCEVVLTRAGQFRPILDELAVANERAVKYPALANAIAADAIAKLNAASEPVRAFTKVTAPVTADLNS